MFDTGASTHLMDGAIAERQNLEKISDRPTTLTVVGGGALQRIMEYLDFFLDPPLKVSTEKLFVKVSHKLLVISKALI